MKTVGSHHRDEFESDPAKAWRRGVALDAMLRAALPQRTRGVWRMTHTHMNRLDLAGQLDQAAKVNRPAP